MRDLHHHEQTQLTEEGMGKNVRWSKLDGKESNEAIALQVWLAKRKTGDRRWKNVGSTSTWTISSWRQRRVIDYRGQAMQMAAVAIRLVHYGGVWHRRYDLARRYWEKRDGKVNGHNDEGLVGQVWVHRDVHPVSRLSTARQYRWKNQERCM